MAQTAPRPATYADLAAVPDHLVAEILFGRLVTHPRPAPRHAGASSILGVILGGPYQLGQNGPGGWTFLDEPELHLGEHVAVPDIAGWRGDRLNDLPEQAWIEIVPDWICEVMSPSTESYDRGEKRAIYGTASVKHLWHIDPRLQLLEAFELRDAKWVLAGVFKANDSVRVPPFDAMEFPLGLLWPFGPPPTQRA